MILLLSFILIFTLFPLLSFAQEQVTITTYYPSPFGSYQDLETLRLVVGDDAMPTVDGVLNFETRNSDPGWSDEGAMYYNDNTHNFRYFDGTAWQDIVSTPCILMTYTTGSVITSCPVGFHLAGFGLKGNYAADSGEFICCRAN